MQENNKKDEIEILVDILQWASENQTKCYQMLRPSYNDELCYKDLIETITELTEKKYYILLLVLITQNKYNCHMDEILDRAICRFCANKVQENDILEFSQFVIENLKEYAAKKEKNEIQ